MANRLEELSSRFDQLALRLRVLITLGVIIILYMLFDTLWFTLNENATRKTSLEIKNVVKQNEQLISMQQEFNQDVKSRRNNPKVKKLAKIDQQIKSIKTDLTNRTIALIQPEDMAGVIKKILKSSKSLNLQLLSKQKSVDLSNELQSQQPKEPNMASDQIRLFRHSMIIKLTGNYASTYKFLKNIEQMDKKVTYENLTYSVDHYPTANIKLTVSTLSFEKEWIGG